MTNRAYFKNDLYTFAAHKEKEQKLEAERKELEKAALKNKARDAARGKVAPVVRVDDSLGIKVDKKENELALENSDDYGQLMKSLKKKVPEQLESEGKQEKKIIRNIFDKGFQPKATLVIKEDPKEVKKTDEEERKQKKQYNIQFKKMETDMKRIVGGEKQEKQQKKEEQGDKSSSEQPEVVKTKRIKKQANYQRLDLKRCYKDRFLGAKHNNLRKYTRNGQLKPKYRMQKEIGMQDGEVYNSYIASLSKSLKLTLTIEDSDQEQGSDAPKAPTWTPPSDMSSKEELTKCLQSYFGFQFFREGQFETIQNILNGRSTLFISETASGKSLTYIMSSMLLKGFSLVISPLVSLMLDQLEHLPLELTGACVSSLLNKEQQRSIAQQVKKGKINILFMTPEMLQTDFIYHLQDFPQANFVCVDEAHSLSQLSHNFRTSFLTLGDIILHMVPYKTKKPTILGLTATANPDTVQSVMQKLEISQLVRSSSCMNKNLYVTVSREGGENKYHALIRYLNNPIILKCRGILVYTRTRYIMDQVFNFINNSLGNQVAIYHGALSNKQKTETLEKFREGKVRIVVATVALGMGLDFEHLECVIHINLPKSIENYVQEIGRAGRRQRRAYCHLFLDPFDYFTQRNYIIADQIEPVLLSMIYQQLKDNSVVRQPKRNKKQTAQMKFMEDELVIKRAAILMEQCHRDEVIYQEDQEQLDSEQVEERQEEGEQIVLPPPKVNSQLFSIRISRIVEMTQLKEEAILTLILKVEHLLKDDHQVRFKVLPTAHQMLKIGFFKQNETEIRNKSQFFRKLVDGCKKAKGSIYIPLIEKCNQLQMKPIQLLTQLYRLKDQYWLKVQQENPIFVWQFQGRKLDLDEGIDHQLGQLVERGFDRLMGGDFITQVVQQMREVQQTTLVKLNTLWSLAYNNAQNNIVNTLNRLPARNQPIPQNGFTTDLDAYFRSPLSVFYDKITKNGEEICIPTQMVYPNQIPIIYDYICSFFKHEMSTLGQLHNAREVTEARNRAIEKYEDGKAITKVFMGITSGEVTWKIYSGRTQWNDKQLKKKNYSQLLEVVREQIQRYKEEHRHREQTE